MMHRQRFMRGFGTAIILCVILLPAVSAEVSTQQKLGYIEWKQHLFSKTNQTARSFANTTFTVTSPHNYTHVGGQSYVYIIGMTNFQTVVTQATNWKPHFKFDNADFNGVCNADFPGISGSTNVWQNIPLELMCRVDKFVADGSHGISMTDSNSVDTPAVRYNWQFYLIQSQSVNTTIVGDEQMNEILETVNVVLPLVIFIIVGMWAWTSRIALVSVLAVVSGGFAALSLWDDLPPSVTLIVVGATVIFIYYTASIVQESHQ